MAYDLELYATRVLPRLDDGPKTLAELGVTSGLIKVMHRNGLVRPKMKPWLNSEGRVVGAIEMWQRAEPPAAKPQREDCALMDFAEMGLT